MESSKEKTIDKIVDLVTGDVIQSKEFFAQHDEPTSFELRRILKENAIDDKPRFVCDTCYQAVQICGGVNLVMYFRHYKDSDDCPIKTKNKYSHQEINRMKYNGAKESEPHKNIKEHLYTYLNQDPLCSEVHKEKVVQMKKVGGDRWWKKPDISAVFKNQEIVIEIQLATTFLDVIVDREKFYRTKGTYILWVFDERELSQYRFTEKDIFYTHNRNAFIIDKASKQKTEETGILHFTCCYQVPVFFFGAIEPEWREKIISVHELMFDEQNFQLIYHDYKEQLKVIEEQQKIIDQQKREEAIHDFENYWVKERDHDKESYTNQDQDQEVIEPLFGYLEIYHVDIPLDFHLIRLLHILFTIKVGYSVGYNMNFLAVTNLGLQSWPQFGLLIMYALDEYDRRSKVENADSFKKKINVIKKEWLSKQDGQHNEFLELFFPKAIARFNKHLAL